MKRNLARLLAILAGVVVPVVTTATPALAKIRPDDGEVLGKPLGAGLTILYFVVIPIGAFLVIAGLALLPSTLARPRYRPGRVWDHRPTWFGGAPDSQVTGESAGQAGGTARGGASAEW